ncbi:MAG: sigma-70 family RNA polymerase sigma factor [Paracoccaceae bacterium]|jgi:RNA polymerase sigma-70 factor (ECF subfamily)
MHKTQASADGIFSDKVVDLIPALRGYALSLHRNRTDADDLVQETLLRALLYADSFQPGTNLRGWLFTIMRNRFYTSRQSAKREMVGIADCVAELPANAPSQELHMEICEVGRAFLALPSHYRHTLAYVVLGGNSYERASREFRCNIGTVKSRVNRGRAMMKSALGLHG